MRKNELLIEANELTQIIGDGNCVLIDCRAKLDDPDWGQREYSRGHLPRAIFADLNTQLSAPPGAGGRHPLPSAKHSQTFWRAGVSPTTRCSFPTTRTITSTLVCFGGWRVGWELNK